MSKILKWFGLFLIILSLGVMLALGGCATTPGTIEGETTPFMWERYPQPGDYP